MHLDDKTQIGLHRTECSYQQDVFQFAHEFTHRCLWGKIPKEYLWFEESMCMLMTYITMNLLYEKYIDEKAERALAIKSFQMANYTNCIPEIRENMLLNPDSDICRTIQYTITRCTEQFVYKDLNILADVKKMPNQKYSNFLEYVYHWEEMVGCERTSLATIVRNVYTMLYRVDEKV